MYGVNSTLSGNWKRRTELVEYCVRVVDQSLNEKRSMVEDETQDNVTKRKLQGRIIEEQVKVENQRAQVHNELKVEAIIRKRAVDAFKARCGIIPTISSYKCRIAVSSLRSIAVLFSSISFYMQLLSLLAAAPITASAHRLIPIFSQDRPAYNFEDVKVPVQLGVMSRCPDALLCENVFDDVLQDVSNKINISLVYVAKLDSHDDVFGVRCMHGPEECAGNIQQLCVAKYEPADWWQFVQCQNYEGKDEVGNPDLALRCADTVGIDWKNSQAGACAGLDGSGTEPEGVALLKESVELSRKLGIEKSCTILINGSKVCIHDGTWKSCENGHNPSDFVRQINEAYDKLNAA
ncbi:hypothetical protein C0993_004413 [Termitomyces sp. T159_Od127]|nr:hypothetical protein C0993_004413 [Termitomyces sp. T159_Od127]